MQGSPPNISQLSVGATNSSGRQQTKAKTGTILRTLPKLRQRRGDAVRDDVRSVAVGLGAVLTQTTWPDFKLAAQCLIKSGQKAEGPYLGVHEPCLVWQLAR